MPIIAALVGIVLGAIAAIAYMRTAKQGSLHLSRINRMNMIF